MPFQKGQSGNPNGRPSQGKSWKDLLNKIGEEVIQVQKKGMSRKEAICRVLYKNAANGDQPAINALMDRMEGKPLQTVEAEVKAEILSIPVHKFVDSPEE
jgi:hypothetical protein